MNGEEVQPNTPGGALRKKVAYLTQDRRLEGFVKDFDNGPNMSLVVLPTKLSRSGVIDLGKERASGSASW